MSRLSLARFAVLVACGNVANHPGTGDDDDDGPGVDAGTLPDGEGPRPDGGGPEPDGAPPQPDAPGPNTPATAAFTFPPAGGLTEGSAITVRGTAVDPDGIAGVKVNGVAALSSDGFATWQATVPMTLGPSDLVVEVTDDRGAVVANAASTHVVNSPNPWANMIGIGVEQSFFPIQPFFVADERLGTIFAVDPASGARTVVSSASRGAGPALPSLTSIVFDNARSRVLIGGFGGVFAVDPSSGDRTAINTDTLFSVLAMSLSGNDTVLVISQPLFGNPILENVNVLDGRRTTISGAGVGTGPAFVTPRDVVVDLLNQRAFVADTGAKTVFRVDLANGNRSILSSAAVGTGPAFDTLASITIDRSFLSSSTQAFVADSGRDAVIRIDLANGNRTILTANGTGTGAAIANARAVNFTSNADLVLADDAGQTLFRVDAATGNRTVLSTSRAGDGPALTLANAAGRDGSRVIASDQASGIFRFDLATTTRSVLAPSGGDLIGPSGLVVVPNANAALFATLTQKLMRVDSTGTTTIVSSSAVGTGPGVPILARLDLDPAGDRVFAGGSTTVMAIDLATGNRTVISDGSHGTGPQLGGVTAVRLAGTRLLALDTSLDALLAIDPATGNRLAISNAATGGGPAFVEPNGLAVTGSTALVADAKLHALVAVTLGNGNRTIVSGAAQRGPALALPQHVSVDSAADVAFVSDFAFGLVAIDLATGHRVILSH